METGWILYLLLAGLMFIFWRKGGGRKMQELLEDSAHHHHRILDVIARHPEGGSWKQHRQWMEKKKK